MMIHSTNIICILSIFLITILGAERTYQFEVYVSALPWSNTVDEIFFRLCNINDICGLFQSVPAGWQSLAQSYSYKYTTNTDIGDIYKAQIVHPGSDMLCIGHIKVNGIEYDENQYNWVDWPHCIEEAAGGGCDTVTIILPDNYWHSALTIPCEYNDLLYNTYSPTSSPITTAQPTTDPIAAPSQSPTISLPNLNTVNANAADVNAQRSDGNIYGAIIGGVIGALLAFVLCLSLIIIALCYCMKQRKNREINEVNNDRNFVSAPTVTSSVSSYEGVMNGTNGTMSLKVNTMPNVFDIVSTKDDHVRENIQLIADNSSEDESNVEELYDNQRRNMTKRIPSEDEDVIPQ